MAIPFSLFGPSCVKVYGDLSLEGCRRLWCSMAAVWEDWACGSRKF